MTDTMNTIIASLQSQFDEQLHRAEKAEEELAQAKQAMVELAERIISDRCEYTCIWNCMEGQNWEVCIKECIDAAMERAKEELEAAALRTPEETL